MNVIEVISLIVVVVIIIIDEIVISNVIIFINYFERKGIVCVCFCIVGGSVYNCV